MQIHKSTCKDGEFAVDQEFQTTLSYVVELERKLWLPVWLLEARLWNEVKKQHSLHQGRSSKSPKLGCCRWHTYGYLVTPPTFCIIFMMMLIEFLSNLKGYIYIYVLDKWFFLTPLFKEQVLERKQPSRIFNFFRWLHQIYSPLSPWR